MRIRNPKWGLIALSASLSFGVACSEESNSQDAQVSQDTGSENKDMGMSMATDMGQMDMGSIDMGVAGCPQTGMPMQAGTAPVRRDDMAYAYDAKCQRVYMFFGDQGEPVNCNFPPSVFSNDAYYYDVPTNTWYELEAPSGPSTRSRSGGAWDAKRNRAIVFGGRWRDGNRGPYTFLGDIWAYDPVAKTWTDITPANGPKPSGRMNFVMVEDAANDRILVMGGGQITPNFSAFITTDETWAFDLETHTWTELGLGGAKLPKRIFQTGALDTKRNKLYVFSGGGDDAFIAPAMQDFWELDLGNDTWTQVTLGRSDPGGLINSRTIYDDVNDRLLMFAGHDNTMLGNNNELWAFDLQNKSWNLLKKGDTYNKPARGQCDFPGDFAIADLESPERRAGHIWVMAGNVAIAHAGNTDCGLANDTWSLDLSNDTWTQLNVSPNGMTCPRTGNPNCADSSASMCD